MLIAATGLAIIDSDSGLETWLQLRHEAREMRARVAATRADVERLGTEIEALRADPLALERAIREDLELARPGEWVIRFAPVDNTNPRFP